MSFPNLLERVDVNGEKIPFSSAKRDSIKYLNAVKEQASGAVVSMDDVSPLSHKVSVGMRGKNLIPYPYVTTTATIDGVTFTDNGDGTITLNGTATKAIIYSPIVVANSFYLESGTYTASSDVIGSYSWIYLQFKTVENDGNLANVANSTKTFTINEAYHVRFNLRISAGASFSDVVVKPQIELGTTATPYMPYVPDDTEVTVKSCGKNILTPQQIYSGADKYLETEYDGRNCVRYVSSSFLYKEFNCFKPNTQYTFTIECCAVPFVGEGGSNRLIEIYYTDGTRTLKGIGASLSWTKNIITTDIGKTIEKIGVASVDYRSYVYVDVNTFQVEEGATATAYEPYEETEVITTVSEGANLDRIAPNMTITTDNLGVVINAEYNKDTNAAINDIKALLASAKNAMLLSNISI